MRIVVIGGSGHIGSFLVPRLVRAGHQVLFLSRGTSTPYTSGEEWSHVERVVADRGQEDRDGVFADRVARLRADVVVDLLCFTLESARTLVDRLRGETGHLVGCGSVWRAGPSTSLPISEADAPPPVGEYGIQKDRIARLLAEETAGGGLVTTSLHPGHISGPGWAPIGPTGNLDPAVWSTLAAGETLQVPGLGAETMHHVHADVVAQAFELAIAHRDAAAGQDFFVTARRVSTCGATPRSPPGGSGSVRTSSTSRGRRSARVSRSSTPRRAGSTSPGARCSRSTRRDGCSGTSRGTPWPTRCGSPSST